MIRAFLIGAGATRAQYENAPLSADFFSLLERKRSDLYEHIQESLRPYNNTPISRLNVEYVMKLQDEVPTSNKQSFIVNLYTAIYDLVAESTESDENSIKRIKNRIKRPPLTLFKNLLLDKDRLDENDFFITLNYDLYLDREIKSIQDNFIDYGIDSEYIHSSSLPPNSNDTKFSLYHLHGSLNWRLVDDKVKIEDWAVVPNHTRNGSNLCIVPPGVKELNPILKGVWENTERRLLNADELIIIGCSLNSDDTELLKLINGFKDKNGSDKIKIIYKKEPGSPDLAEYYYSLFGTSVRIYNKGFHLTRGDGYPGAIEFIFK